MWTKPVLVSVCSFLAKTQIRTYTLLFTSYENVNDNKKTILLFFSYCMLVALNTPVFVEKKQHLHFFFLNCQNLREKMHTRLGILPQKNDHFFGTPSNCLSA